jgi:hypothetical protein
MKYRPHVITHISPTIAVILTTITGETMAGITLVQAEAKLTLYMSLDDTMGANAEITIDGTTIKRRDIQKQIEYWNSWVVRLTPSSASGSNRVRQVIPR